MIIYIEVVIIFILMLMFIFWKMWFWVSKKRLLKKYNPEKDLGRLAEIKRKLENHDGNKKQKIGKRSSRYRTERRRRRSSSNKESVVSSGGSELPQDNPDAINKPVVIANSGTDEKKQRSLRRRLRRKF